MLLGGIMSSDYCQFLKGWRFHLFSSSPLPPLPGPSSPLIHTNVPGRPEVGGEAGDSLASITSVELRFRKTY